MSYDHTALFQVVRNLLEEHDEDYLRNCIQDCHNGTLRGPINTENLHLFRRYRNDPERGSGNAQQLLDAATSPFYLNEPMPIEIDASIHVTLKVIERSNSKFGVSHVDLELGGTPLPGIAMYACVDGNESRWVTSDEWDRAEQWFIDHGADVSDLKLLKSAYEEE